MRHILVLLLSATSLFAADLKVKITKAATSAGFLPAFPVRPETTLYVHDTVQREEFVGYVDGFQGPRGLEPHMAVITHCDSGIAYEIDLDAREYREHKIPKYPSREKFEKQVAQARKEEQNDTKANTVDAHETRDFFGHTARHLITTIKKSTGNVESENTVDGWYVDLPQPGCAPEYTRWNQGHEATVARVAVLVPVGRDGPAQLGRIDPNRLPLTPSPSFVYTGFEPSGFAIERKSVWHQTLKLSGDKESTDSTMVQRVLEFSESPLDPALFEVPAGFKRVNKLYSKLKEQRY
jgi:hypothetical protein